jgi:hypothetical protein
MSSDPLDRASEVEELQRQVALTNRKQEAPKVSGTCLFCEEKIAPERRWCDRECRDLWEMENVQP